MSLPQRMRQLLVGLIVDHDVDRLQALLDGVPFLVDLNEVMSFDISSQSADLGVEVPHRNAIILPSLHPVVLH